MGDLIPTRYAVPRTLPPEIVRQELDGRESYGLSVTLWWVVASNTLQLQYIDEKEPHQSFITFVPNHLGNVAMRRPNEFRPKADDGS